MKRRLFVLLTVCSFALVGCQKWLTVASDTEIANEDQFRDQQGFMDAVIGVYTLLGQEALYGKNLTWGYVEFLGRNYELVASSAYKDYFDYNYTSSTVSSTISSVWGAAYNTIANINNLLKWERERGEVMVPAIDSLVKGEMLAVRAMLHFDLLRMHGKGNLAKHPEHLKELSIPYQTEYRKELPPRYTYGETLQFIIEDLRQSIAYLEMDPVRNVRGENFYERLYFEGFLTSTPSLRSNRMNYYAAKLLLARVLMWRGTEEDKQEAFALTEDIYLHAQGNTEETLTTLVYATSFNAAEWWNRETDMRGEWIFALDVEGLGELTGGAFGANDVGSATLYLSSASVTERFELPDLQLDYRYLKALEGEGYNRENYSILKNRKPTEIKNAMFRENTLLMRLPEVYYIMAECLMTSSELYNRVRAVRLLNEIREVRNINRTLSAARLQDAEIIDEITKEYRKEFIGEGIQFFHYKRLGMESIPGTNKTMTDVQYVIPWSETEAEYY